MQRMNGHQMGTRCQTKRPVNLYTRLSNQEPSHLLSPRISRNRQDQVLTMTSLPSTITIFIHRRLVEKYRHEKPSDTVDMNSPVAER